MDWHTHINNIHWGSCCLTISLPWFKREGLPNHWQSLFKKLWILHSNIHVWCPFSFPQCAILDTWNDCYGGFSAMKSSGSIPFYCLKFAPFYGRHSFLCIVAVCWWKNEAYTDWHYSILLLSVIINRVTFVTDVKVLLPTPFIAWNLHPFCERHSFLYIVAVCWWKKEAWDWYCNYVMVSSQNIGQVNTSTCF